MNDLLPVAVRQALAEHGVADFDARVRSLPGGNADRRLDTPRRNVKLQLRDGSWCKLTIGRGLSTGEERIIAFATALPALTKPPLFHFELPEGDVLAQPFIEGIPLDAAAADPAYAAEALRDVLGRIQVELTRTGSPSTPAARADEWQQWNDALLNAPVWNPTDADLLRSHVLPPLERHLCAGPAVTHWTHGDLTPQNILIQPNGIPALIDAEFAGATHFAIVEWARFEALGLDLHPALAPLRDALPALDPGWRLFFWLEQIRREATYNHAGYSIRWLPWRLARVRSLLDELGWPLPPFCPWPAHRRAGRSLPSPSVRCAIEEERWLADDPRHAIRFSGWCHVIDEDVSFISAEVGGRNVARASPHARPDVHAQLEAAPHALQSGFVLDLPSVPHADDLITLVAHTATGVRFPFHQALAGELPSRGPLMLDYPQWAARWDPDPPAPLPGAADANVKFSLLLPVFNTPQPLLGACLQAVRRQYHPHWELCIVDDGSTETHIAPMLATAAGEDSRIRLTTRGTNGGIACATNDALAMATGEFVVLLDHDDLLRPHALAEIARFLIAAPDCDALYSDEDKITETGERIIPFLKPDFSPEFLRGVMYPGHVLCVRTSVARAVGGFDSAFDGIQDYEFFLRVTEATPKIGHLPRILYHWRQSASSSALHGDVKGDMEAKQAEAVRAHLKRLEQPRQVVPLGDHRLRLSAASSNTSVAIIIGWPAGTVAPKPFWDSLRSGNLRDLFVVDDLPVPTGEAHATLHSARGAGPRSWLDEAAQRTDADVIVVLTAPVLSGDRGWLEELAGLAVLPDSGVVAPLLLARNGSVLESGWLLHRSAALPLMPAFDATREGYNGALFCNREVSAVSPLCFAIRRSILPASAATETPAADLWAVLDLCVHVQAQGRYNRVAASARLQTGLDWQGRAAEAESAFATLPAAWKARLTASDPYYDPHFAPRAADYRLLPAPASPDAAVLWHCDTPPAPRLKQGCLLLRGWALHVRGGPFVLRASVAGISWTVDARQPRPDVAAAQPELTDGLCGFRLSLRVPPGQHTLEVDALIEDGTTQRLLSQPVHVPRLAPLHRCLSSDSSHRIGYQLMAVPAHPPRPLRLETFPEGRTSQAAELPKITIVTPSFQHARYLETTIRSVLDQPDVRIDYVVQDGGSTDGSAALIARHANRLFASESVRDHGQADAIARGFAKTSGEAEEVMAWINSDDFYMPGALRYVADYFARHPDVDVLYGHRVLVDEASNEIGRWYLPRHDAKVLRLSDFVPQETLFWRRRAWDLVDGLDTSFRFALDWDLLLRFQDAGARIVRVPFFLGCFRIHAAQKTSAQLDSIGRQEIDRLRERAFGRVLPPIEVEAHPAMTRYLRESAWLEFAARFGYRGR